jgi:hypothetical protein
MENFKSLSLVSKLTANFLKMKGNEENTNCDPSRAFVFIDVFSFRAKSEGATIYGGLVVHIPS